ncbi:Uncharacterized protein M6B38_220750 [Iris pallida]|uniref:Uncharacterized protein n=1 Tax=Iris pallida TaxID=29817 RepID=A0AAX6DYX9_IRIPA|nr:Uncharacterized protein M6B38_220750 [Iris pallida]
MPEVTGLKKSFHKFLKLVDLSGDFLGMSVHPLTPVVLLHHFNYVDLLFPGMNHTSALKLKHLFEVIILDPGRMLQQTVCYDPLKLYSVSVSWGYVVQVYKGKLLLPDLLPSQQTFTPWKSRGISSSLFMFNTRELPKDQCKRPTTFFLGGVLYSVGKIWRALILNKPLEVVSRAWVP